MAARITETSADHALRVIREAGGRLTNTTRTVIAVLGEGDEHLTAEDLITEVERRLPSVAPSTVYRVIQRLGELDLIEHIHTNVGPPVYHLRDRGHAHLVCNVCGTIIDISDDHLAALQKTLLKQFGFTLSTHHSALLGHCTNCTPTHHH